eukprot:jgi/Mesvir1/27053/Mv25923-RA.1
MPSITVIVGYAPHAGRAQSEREAFFDALKEEEANIPARHFLVMLLDANATLPVGTGGAQYSPTNTTANGNTSLFANLLAESALVACNASFARPAEQLATFFGPSDRVVCLDYVCVRRAQRPSVVDARVLQDSVSTVESDHRLVLARIRLRFPGVKPSRQLAPQPDLKVLRIVLKDADKMSAEEQAAMSHRDDFLAVFDAGGSRQQLHAIPPPGDISVILRGVAAKYRLAARTLPTLPPRRQLAVHRHAPTVVAARQMLRRNRDPLAKPGLQAALRAAYEQAEKADGSADGQGPTQLPGRSTTARGPGSGTSASGTRTASAGPTATTSPAPQPSGFVPGPRPRPRSWGQLRRPHPCSQPPPPARPPWPAPQGPRPRLGQRRTT